MKTVIPGYQIEEELVYESSQTLILKGNRDGDTTEVILKLLKDERPSEHEIARIRQEFEIIKSFDSPFIIHAIALEKFQNNYAIVLEHIKGCSLADILRKRKRFDLKEFLEWAIRITEGIGEVHHHNIVHNDINPANIMIDSGRKEAKIIDFNLSTSLPKVWIQMVNPNLLKGTLAYLSPEQTGRMNRGIDYRTDFYSLGITFYQMLTGRLPFLSPDPLELIHGHIAIIPTSPDQLDPEIPEVVSSMIMKLLAKNAEKRYQNTQGLLYDLRTCLTQLQTTGTIAPFPLGSKDLFYYFQISEELYGRTQEANILLSSYEEVSQGGIELLLVTGYSGIGKSSLVHEIYKPVVEKRGFFISGKFEQFKHSVPYGAFIEAFNDLVDQILTESEENIALLRKKILLAVEDQGQIIIDVIPNLALIIGEQQAIPILNPIDSQNRFSAVFQRLITTLATHEHPLTLFLDDLQWADISSLKLLETLLTSFGCHYLFIIGAYRSNEVTLVHPLMSTLERLRKQNVLCKTIELGPLELGHVKELLADSLHQEIDDVTLLAEICYEKTKGNPFFLKQLLLQLYKDQIIEFEFSNNRWNWDLEKIRGKAISDNVVDLMIEKIGQLSSNAQYLIKMGACIGGQFTLNILSQLSEMDAQKVYAGLEELMKENLIARKGGGQEDTVVQFVHDRILQAAYQLVEEGERKAIHINLSRLLLENTPKEKLNEAIFDIVNHFNKGIEPNIPPEISLTKRKKMAEMNRRAAYLAKAAAAYELALKYAEYNLKCLGDELKSDQELMFESYALIVENASLSSRIDTMEKYSALALQVAKEPAQEFQIKRVQIFHLYSQYQFKEGLDIAIEMLSRLGVKIPKKPTRFDALRAIVKGRFLFLGKDIPLLIDLPQMTDPKQKLIMEVLAASFYSITHSDPLLYPILTYLALKLSLKYGNSKESSQAYAIYGALCCGLLHSFEKGYQFGDLALNLVAKMHDKERKTRVVFSNYTLIKPWKDPLKKMLPVLLENYEEGLNSGQYLYAHFSLIWYYGYSLNIGLSLKEILPKLILHKGRINNFEDRNNYISLSIIEQVMLNLVEDLDQPGKLLGESYNENIMMPLHREDDNKSLMFFIYYHKILLSYLFEDQTESKRCIQECDQFSEAHKVIQSTSYFPMYVAFKSLTLINGYQEVSANEKLAIKRIVKANQKRMKEWAKLTPENHAHRYYLVEAEWTGKILNRMEEAVELYKKAIALAHQNEFLNDEALANELLAKFYLSRLDEKVARIYLEDARYCYLLWGAEAKVTQLEKKYGSLFNEKHNLKESPLTSLNSVYSSDMSLHTSSNLLDVGTILKFSQAISGIISLQDLLKKLMHLILENAGAQRSILLLYSGRHPYHNAERVRSEVRTAESSRLLSSKLDPIQREGKYLIEAEATIDQDEKVLQAIEPTAEMIPLTIIHYVIHAKESIVLDNAVRINRFNDPYIVNNQCKSLLCIPLLNQGILSGILYLENNLVEGAFTKDRIDLLNHLSSQIAVSIDNARLYDNTVQLNEFLNTLNHSYERLVPQDFLNLLERKSIIDVSLGDHIEKNMTVLFTDIRNFTTLSEQMSPEKNFIFINAFLKVMAPLIRKHQGFIDKYIGDAIMALFPNNSDDAVRCAIEMHYALKEFNSTQNELEPIEIGIGINTGLLMLGTVGEEHRFGVTAISDAVNIASRVETLTKTYGEKILITEATYRSLLNPDDYLIDEIGSTLVKGKTKEITLYKVGGVFPDL